MVETKWCGFYPTNTGRQVRPGYEAGECIKTAPAPVWQCNSGNVCVAAIDGFDIDAAASLSREADVAIVVVATYSNEGTDRASLSFAPFTNGVCDVVAPGQDNLISVIAATNTPTVVAVVSPGAFLSPWRNSVKAIVFSGLPGQQYVSK